MRSLDFGSTHSPPMNSLGGRLKNLATAADGSGCAAIDLGAMEAFTRISPEVGN
jgi:hypothetical protein